MVVILKTFIQLYWEKQIMGKKTENTATYLGEQDGVTVAEKDNQLLVSFNYNATLMNNIKAMGEQVKFSKEDKAYVIPEGLKQEGIQKIGELRTTFVALQDAKADIFEQADKVNVGTIVKDAYQKDHTRTTGKIIAMNDFYVAQYTGSKDDKKYTTIHEKSALSDQSVKVGDQKAIIYEKGLAIVSDRKYEAKPAKEAEKTETQTPTVEKAKEKSM